MLLLYGSTLCSAWTISLLFFDQLEYVNLTLRWLESGIYAYRDTMPNTLVTPGLPVFLAAVFSLFGYHPLEHGLMAVRLSQCFIGVGAVWFMYKLGARLFHPATGVLAAFFRRRVFPVCHVGDAHFNRSSFFLPVSQLFSICR